MCRAVKECCDSVEPNSEIGIAVAIEVASGNRLAKCRGQRCLGAHGHGERTRPEQYSRTAALASAGTGNSDVGETVVVEIGHRDRGWLIGDAVGGSCGVETTAGTAVEEHKDGGIYLAQYGEVRIAVAVDVAGRNAGGRCSDRIGVGTRKALAIGLVNEDRCIEVGVVADGEVGEAVLIKVGHGDAGEGHRIKRIAP